MKKLQCLMCLIKINLSARIHSLDAIEKSLNRPFCMIIRGSVLVKNPLLPPSESVIAELRVGDVFGESDLLRLPGIEFFGNLVAGPKGVECLLLIAPELTLDMYERETLKDEVKTRHR